ncbi:hypothetical protein ABIE60_000138 [Marinobacterium sp. MBR-109]
MTLSAGKERKSTSCDEALESIHPVQRILSNEVGLIHAFIFL